MVMTNTQGASGSLNAMKFKEIKEFYLMQKITITSLVLTTTAGLQMDALSTVSLVVIQRGHCAFMLRASDSKKTFDIRPVVLIRPDTSLVY